MTARRTVFYSGGSMEPTAIRRADPTARFLARGAVARPGADLPERFASHVDDQVWGIVVEVDGDAADAPTFDVTLDDGRTVSASLAEPLLAGDPAAVLANARYWELPPSHVALLTAALNVVDEE